MTTINAADLVPGNIIAVTADGGAGRIVSVGEPVKGGIPGFGDPRDCAVEVTVEALSDWGGAWGVNKGDTYTTTFTYRA
jgi:hypothetical protein